MKQTARMAIIFTILFSLLGNIAIQPARAATHWVVVNTNDSGPGSLRQTILVASNGDTISFDTSLAGETILLESQLEIDKSITIDGSILDSQITISGYDLHRVIHVNSGVTVTLDSLIIAHGKSPLNQSGGGIYNSGTLTVINSTISENNANYGAGIFNKNGTLTLIDSSVSYNASYGRGGGLYNEVGAVTISSTTLSHNNAKFTGGGFYNNGGTVTIDHSTFSDNTGDPLVSSYAGGLYNDGGTLTINDSNFFNNSANSSGGGILNTGGPLTIMNSIFSGNSASGYGSVGGGIDNTDLLIITDSFFSENSAEYGGALYTHGELTVVTNSTFFGNQAEDGGGISNSGTLTVTDSTFSGNGSDNYGSDGGGISNDGIARVANSTFFENFAYMGGGIHNRNTVEVTNSTFFGNEAGWGGGIANSGDIVGGTLMVKNSTFSANAAQHGGGIANLFISSQKSVLHYTNTIIANTTSGGDCYNVGKIGTNLKNLVEDGSCSASISGDPKLAPLADNGGGTLTMALLGGSPAIDAGNSDACDDSPGPNNLDQRGVIRPQGNHCDIGAFEFEPTFFANLIFQAVALQDGWILEGTETSNVGGTKNNAATTINLGDDSANRQYRVVLSFNSAIPGGANITKVTLKLKRQGVTGGGNPVNTFGGFLVDIKKGNFGKAGLQLTDFSAKADQTLGAFKPKLADGWYAINLTKAKVQINKTGNTQIRLRFKLDDNNNGVANFLKLYSGNAGTANAPQLIVEYYVP